MFLRSLLLIPIHPIKRREDEDEEENPGKNASNDGEDAEGEGHRLTKPYLRTFTSTHFPTVSLQKKKTPDFLMQDMIDVRC